MALSEKEVFFALLKNLNPSSSLRDVCARAGLEYNKIYKRLERASLQQLSNMEMQDLCRALNVSVEGMFGLLVRVSNGEFADDYPREKITLDVIDWGKVDERVIMKRITKQENILLEALRGGDSKKIDAIISALEEL